MWRKSWIALTRLTKTSVGIYIVDVARDCNRKPVITCPLAALDPTRGLLTIRMGSRNDAPHRTEARKAQGSKKIASKSRRQRKADAVAARERNPSITNRMILIRKAAHILLCLRPRSHRSSEPRAVNTTPLSPRLRTMNGPKAPHGSVGTDHDLLIPQHPPCRRGCCTSMSSCARSLEPPA